MYVFLTILAIVICLLLILIVLIQEPKGGGLSSSFGASNQIMGVKKTGDFLEQATWGLAIGLLVICLGMKAFSPSSRQESVLQQQVEKVGTQSRVPANTPAGSPAATPSSSPAAVPTNRPTTAPLKLPAVKKKQ